MGASQMYFKCNVSSNYARFELKWGAKISMACSTQRVTMGAARNPIIKGPKIFAVLGLTPKITAFSQ